MSGTIERLLEVERKAKQVVEGAQQQAQQITEEARSRARDTVERIAAQARDEAEQIVRERRDQAQGQRQEMLQKAQMEAPGAQDVPEDRVRRAVDHIVRVVAWAEDDKED